ncbi:Putative sodium-dependent multivitamin transporter [Gryllus bimaculatus]|nr:Putative sodium-dependent multivitamin transporter [Gryllus bimaculatus]
MAVVEETFFGAWDYVVLGLVLLTSASIGVYYRLTGGRQKTVEEYLLGNQSLSVLPVAFSLMASFMSAITLMGVSTENYMYGTQFVVINFGYGLVTPVAAYGFLPVFFRLRSTSAYQYLEMRFGPRVRLLASIAFSLQMVLYMGIVLYAPALAVEAVTGLPKMGAILAVGLVCTFYSTIGGMKAVVITDVFQSLLMFAAVIMVCVTAAIQVGGVDEIWRIAAEYERIEFDNFSLNPKERHTWWSLVIGGGFTYLSLYAVNQAQVQRLISLRDLRASQKALWVSWPILSLLSLSTSFSGLAIFSKYYNCDPLDLGRIASVEQLMPLYVVDSVSHIPGLSGLFVAGIFSGSLSTVSSAVNSLAAVTLEDYLKPIYRLLYKSELPERRTSLYTKILAFLYGLVCLAVAFLAQFLGGVLQASLTIFGVIGGPLLATFTLGMFVILANEVGAFVGLLFGLCISMWLGFGGPKPPLRKLPTTTDGCFEGNLTFFTTATPVTPTEPNTSSGEYFYLYSLSYLWYIVLGFLITLFIGTIVSCLYNCYAKKIETDLNPDLFSPFVRKYVKRRQRKYQADTVMIPALRNGTDNHLSEPKLVGSPH